MIRFRCVFWLAPALITSALGKPNLSGPAVAVPAADSTDSGMALAAEVRSLRPEENAEFNGVLVIRHRGGQTSWVPVRGQVVAEGTSWRTIYETSPTNGLPAEKLVVIHAKETPNRYLFERRKGSAAAAGETEALAGDRIWAPLAGSDFLLADLGMEFLHWPEQQLIKRNEMRKGRPCRLLESKTPRTAVGGYARVLSWVDQETDGIVAAEAYDAAGQLVKEFSLRNFKKIRGRWQLQEMEIRSVRTGSRTRLEFNLQ